MTTVERVTQPAPTVVRYEMRGAALELMRCRDPLVVMSGPGGTGKTLAALWKLHAACSQMPELKGLLVRQTHVSLTATTIATFERDILGPWLGAGAVTWFGGSARRPPAYIYKNGSSISVGGLDRASKLLGSEYDRVVVDEAVEVSEDTIETLLMRQRGVAKTYRQVVLCCNPDRPTHWIKQRAAKQGLLMLESRHRDNPRYYSAEGVLTAEGIEYIEGKLGLLTGVRRLRYRDGVWAGAEGQVFEGFDRAIHVIPPPKFDGDTRLCRRGLPWSWPRWWGIDFGFNHPTVIQRWAEKPDGELMLYAEQYMTHRTVEEHAADLKKQVRPHGEWIEPQPRAILADHDAEDRETFHKHFGMSTTAANKKVKPGLDAVNDRLKIGKNGKPRIFFLTNTVAEYDKSLLEAKKPACTIDEFGGYIWDERKDAPVKEMDDGSDTMRYVVAHRDLGGTTRVRFI